MMYIHVYNIYIILYNIYSFTTSPFFLCNQAAFTRSATKNHAGGAPSWLTTKHLEEHLSLQGPPVRTGDHQHGMEDETCFKMF